MNSQINEAVVHAHLSGNLHAAALMMGQSATNEAIALAHANPGLQVGWHLHLCDSMPVTRKNWPWGSSHTRAGIEISFSRKSHELMRAEIRRQWELFRESGLKCHFVNGHHHLHAHPAIYQTLLEVLGPEFKGWIRLGRIRLFKQNVPLVSAPKMADLLFQRARKLSKLRSADTLWGINRLCSMKADEIRAVIAALPEGFHEFLFHPRSLSCPDTQCLLELRPPPVS